MRRASCFLGANSVPPIALEGALKLKEITYRFAEGHPSAELKHGVIALTAGSFVDHDRSG